MRRSIPFALRPFLRIVSAIFLLFSVGIIGTVYYYGHDLPRRLDLTSRYRPSIVSTVYDGGGLPIGEFYHQRRIVVPLDRIPSHVIQAFLAVLLSFKRGRSF